MTRIIWIQDSFTCSHFMLLLLINISDLFVGCIFWPVLHVLRRCVFWPALGLYCYHDTGLQSFFSDKLFFIFSDLLHLDELCFHGTRSICLTHSLEPAYLERIIRCGTWPCGPLQLSGVLSTSCCIFILSLKEEWNASGQSQSHNRFHFYPLSFGQMDTKYFWAA